MDAIMYYICIPLGYLMKWCWQLVENYGVAIILFTLATKLVLLPLSVLAAALVVLYPRRYR